MEIQFRLGVGAYAPQKAHVTDAGWDIRSSGDVTVWAKGGIPAIVLTDLYLSIPPGWYGKLETRSSFAAQGLIVVGGVIDAGYIGQIMVMIANLGSLDCAISRGDKIAQLLILPVPNVQFVQVDTLPDTPRGANGFGSSGV